MPARSASSTKRSSWIEDDLALRGADATRILGDGDAANDEDGDALNDTNRTLVIRATGYARDNTSVVLEALVAPIPLPAIGSNGDLALSGAATVADSKGDVRTNGDLTIASSPTVTGDGSALGNLNCSGSCDQVQGTATAGATEMSFPTVRASDYRSLADFILKSDGQLTQPDGTLLCNAGPGFSSTNCRPTYGWRYDGDGWSVGTPGGHPPATFYVEGVARMSGNPWGYSGVQMTIIAEGSINITGNPNIAPDTPELLLLTDGDLYINGNMTTYVQAQMLAHEQVYISGSYLLAGQVLAEDAATVSTLVTSSQVGGSGTIVYDGGLGAGLLAVSSWRDVR